LGISDGTQFYRKEAGPLAIPGYPGFYRDCPAGERAEEAKGKFSGNFRWGTPQSTGWIGRGVPFGKLSNGTKKAGPMGGDGVHLPEGALKELPRLGAGAGVLAGRELGSWKAGHHGKLFPDVGKGSGGTGKLTLKLPRGGVAQKPTFEKGQ